MLVILGVTFFTRNNVRSVREIAPEVLKEPVQSELADHSVIRFTRNDYAYELTPVHGYDISGLITSKLNYAFFTIYKSEKTFPVDLCLLWGSNAQRQVFSMQGVSFSQDCRWCWVRWDKDVGFDLNELSNNHLLISDPLLEKKIKDFHAGDQVRIRGKLVNVKAKLLGKGGNYDFREITWNTSTTRTDHGAGACEVIYVEEAEVLKKANVLSCILFSASAYGLLLWFLWNVFGFVRELVRASKEISSEGSS
jgi:hypothetical protein